MSIVRMPSPKYWNYFLALEGDLVRLSRYIEFAEDNDPAYSIEMAKILLSTCSEVDVIAKALCRLCNPKKKAKNIDDYKLIILKKFNTFPMTEIRVERFGLSFTPWSNWKKTKRHPDWWTEHNAVKHERHDNFQKANLKNVLNAMAGLFCLLINYHLLKEEYPQLTPRPQLFFMPELFMRAPGFWGNNSD